MGEQSEMRLIPTGLVNNLINYLQTQPYGQVYQLIGALTKLGPTSSQPQMPPIRVKTEEKKVS